MSRGYQHNFSDKHHAAMHHQEGRTRKARTMVAVLKDYFKSDIEKLSLLDVGSSTGIIDNFLADHAGMVTGLDIDKHGVAFAEKTFKKNNLFFLAGDAMRLPISDCSFDIVICSQVYEHVPDAKLLLAEIRRVLKKEGVCYFAAGNRFAVEEHHYNLPFLSALPRPLAHIYMRLAGRGSYYYEKHLSYWGLKNLVGGFRVIDYTKPVINNPSRFHADYLLKQETLKSQAARIVAEYCMWLCPGYIWLLKKS